jgi:hypothetical protein
MCFARALLAFCLFLAVASTAHADAILTLTTLTPENAAGGYLPGTVVNFQVDVSQDKATSTPIRSVQLDFSASDPVLTFLGPEFAFDFSTAFDGILYAEFPTYPRPAATYTSPSPTPMFMLEIPAAGAGSLILGTGQVALPITPGTYLLDAVNPGAVDPWSQGAQVRFGFGGADPITAWLVQSPPGDGLVTGQPLSLRVVPEPTTLALLMLGAVACLAGRLYRSQCN